MIKKLTISEELIKLMHFIFLEEEGDDKIVINKKIQFNLGSHLDEDMAMILGYEDKAIKGTEEDPEGRAYPDDVENHMRELYKYMCDNIYYILTLIFQYVGKKLVPGIYKCKDNELIWTLEKEL